MFRVADKDYLPLDGYTFGWRWTESDRIDLSSDERSRIKPLTYEKSAEAWEYAKGFQGNDYWSRFQEVDEFAVDGRGASMYDDVVRDWLRTHLSADNETIFISWTQRQAIETDLAMFVQYWMTFCYPVEDVVIWPASERWVLLFDYKQRFYYAVEKATP